MKPFFATVLAFGYLTASLSAAAGAARLPNVVIVFCDDLAYADVGCFGAKGYKTPNIDRLAKRGIRFTDFYVAQAVCSASRAALLTGCYPNRVGILGALGPNAKIGLNTNEVTLARLLKERGYTTAIYGKWHLGRPAPLLPPAHGFDDYFGLPYSNDMWPKHPTGGTNYPLLPLLAGTNVVELMPDQRRLTTEYTQRAVKFIASNREKPFFLYLAHNMPHVPLHVSAKFAGKTKRGLFGDVIEEIDWSVGEVVKALEQQKLEKDTLFIFASDNGPWLSYGDHAGSAAPLREGKGTSFDGGTRVPFIASWPGRIPKGAVCREPAMTIDLLPTIAHLVSAPLPSRKIDGLDIWPLLSGVRGAKSPHDAYWFYWGNELHGIRSGEWKLHLPHDYIHPNPPGSGGKPGKMETRKIGEALFNLGRDPRETNDVSAQHPKIVKRLRAEAEKAREELGDSLMKRKGNALREPGKI